MRPFSCLALLFRSMVGNVLQSIKTLARAYFRAPRRGRFDLGESIRFGLLLAKGHPGICVDYSACRFPNDHLNFARRYVGRCHQQREELLQFIDYAIATEPKTFVELGVGGGGTHYVITTSIPSIEASIAVDRFVRNRVRLSYLARPGLDFTAVDGDSSASDTINNVRTALDGRQIDLLFIDADHSFNGALADFRAYRSLVAPGGLIAFHDIVPDAELRGLPGSREIGGEVPILWEILSSQFERREFVYDWNQYGKGIGVIRNNPSTAVSLWPEGYCRGGKG